MIKEQLIKEVLTEINKCREIHKAGGFRANTLTTYQREALTKILGGYNPTVQDICNIRGIGTMDDEILGQIINEILDNTTLEEK